MPDLKAVVFDVDGVIVDSKEANAEFYAVLLEEAGYKRPPRNVIDRYFHLPMWQTIEKLIGSNDKAEIQRTWDMAHKHSFYPDHLLVFPDELEGNLASLHKHFRLAIVTGRIKQGVEVLYSARKIKKYFDAVVTYEDYTYPKPHPEPLQVALKKLDVRPNEAVYIGDSHVDVEAATTAGVWSIHLSPRTHNDATVGITSFDEVFSAVQKVAKKARGKSDNR